MDIVSDRLARAGRRINDVLADVIRRARTSPGHEQTIATGRQVGLSDDQTLEVIETYTDWYSPAIAGPDWPHVQRGVIARALGLPWGPTLTLSSGAHLSRRIAPADATGRDA